MGVYNDGEHVERFWAGGIAVFYLNFRLYICSRALCQNTESPVCYNKVKVWSSSFVGFYISFSRWYGLKHWRCVTYLVPGTKRCFVQTTAGDIHCQFHNTYGASVLCSVVYSSGGHPSYSLGRWWDQVTELHFVHSSIQMQRLQWNWYLKFICWTIMWQCFEIYGIGIKWPLE